MASSSKKKSRPTTSSLTENSQPIPVFSKKKSDLSPSVLNNSMLTPSFSTNKSQTTLNFSKTKFQLTPFSSKKSQQMPTPLNKNTLETVACTLSYLTENSESVPSISKLKTEMKFPCNLCGTLFTYSCNLSRHRRVQHAGEEPYKCSRCGHGSFDNNRFLEHTRKCSGKGQIYKCPVCSRTFIRQQLLRMHMSYHENKDHVSDASFSLSKLQCFLSYFYKL